MDALGRPDLPARERLITAVDGGDRRLLTAANAALGCIGLYVGAVGPSLSTIARDGGVALDTAGFVVAAMAAGSVVASGLVAARLHRRSQRRIAALGTAGMAMGLLGLAWAGPWPLILVVALLTGAGGGLADAGTHGLAASAGRPDVAVSQLNRAFAFGAMVGPAWAGVVLQTTGDRWPVFVAPAVVAAVVAVMLARAPEREAVTASVRDSPARPANIPGAAMVMAALLFLYVGAEIGLGAWTTAATRRAADASILVGALVTSAYWGAAGIRGGCRPYPSGGRGSAAWHWPGRGAWWQRGRSPRPSRGSASGRSGRRPSLSGPGVRRPARLRSWLPWGTAAASCCR
jgi:MFS family permease